jgi:hypothetical protein
MTVPGFTAEAALADKGGSYREAYRLNAAPSGAAVPQVVQWCLPCRNGVRLCCNPTTCYLVQCYPA